MICKHGFGANLARAGYIPVNTNIMSTLISHFIELPMEIYPLILQYLPCQDIIKMESVGMATDNSAQLWADSPLHDIDQPTFPRPHSPYAGHPLSTRTLF